MKIAVPVDIGESGIVPDIPGKAQQDAVAVRGDPLQKVHIAEIAGIEPDVIQFRQVRKERSVPETVGVEIALDMDPLKRRAAGDGRIIRNFRGIPDIQVVQFFQAPHGGDIAERVHILDPEPLQAFEPFHKGQRGSREIADLQLPELFHPGDPGKVDAAEPLPVRDAELFQRLRRKAGKKPGRLSVQVDPGFLQRRAFRQRRKIRDVRPIVQDAGNAGSGKPVEASDMAVAYPDASVFQKPGHIRHRGEGRIHERHVQRPEIRHEAQEAQIVILGHPVLVPVFLAVPVRAVVRPAVIGFRIEIDVPVFPRSEKKQVAYDRHARDPFQVFLGDPVRNAYLLFLRQFRLSLRVLLRDMGSSCQNKGKDDRERARPRDRPEQPFRHAGLRNGGADPLRGLFGGTALRRDDVPRVQHILEVPRDGRSVQLERNDRLHPRGDAVQYRFPFLRVAVERFRQHGKHSVVFPRRAGQIRRAEPGCAERVQNRRKAFAVLLTGKYADRPSVFHAKSSK